MVIYQNALLAEGDGNDSTCLNEEMNMMNSWCEWRQTDEHARVTKEGKDGKWEGSSFHSNIVV